MGCSAGARCRRNVLLDRSWPAAVLRGGPRGFWKTGAVVVGYPFFGTRNQEPLTWLAFWTRAVPQLISKSTSRYLTRWTSFGTIAGMLVGYARVSTGDQHLDLQKDALVKAGCERHFADVASGGLPEREGLRGALDFVRPGDTLVVWKLDRLGRSLRHLIDVVADLQKRNIGFRSLQEALDSTTSGGKLVFHVFAALAEFERDIIRERTMAGLAAARARGRRGGRPRKLAAKQIEMAVALLKNPQTSVKDVCQTLDVLKSSLYRYLPRGQQGQTQRR